MKRIDFKSGTLLCALGALSTGCGDSSFSGGGGVGGTGSSGSFTVSGTVSAKSGTLGVPVTALQRLWNGLVGGSAVAALPGVTAVAGVTVKLYALDSSGAVVGDALDMTFTDMSGMYALRVSGNSNTPSIANGLLLRAEGAESLAAFVTGTTVDINPVSDVTVSVVTDLIPDLASLSVPELSQISNAVHAAYNDIDPDEAANNADLVMALTSTVATDEEGRSLVLNSAATQQVCGTVTNVASTALAEVTIAARDFQDLVLRATTKTGATGAYCLDLRPGDYIIGARNYTSASTAASEWYTSGGGVSEQHRAEKITITSGDPVKTINFELGAGARLTGTVTAGAQAASGSVFWRAGDALKNIQITIRRYDDRTPVESVRTDDGGAYQVNLAPGDYFIAATNYSIQPYASEVYDGASGANVQERAARLTVTENQTRTVNFVLEPGKAISGVVKKNSGDAAPGQRVRIDAGNGGAAVCMRANLEGKYCVWLKPVSYQVHSRGQSTTVDLSTGDGSNTNFDDPMAEVTVKLVEAAKPGAPVPGATLFLRDPASWGIASEEISRGDGTAILYSPYDANARTVRRYGMEIKLDRREYLASQLYDGKTSKATANVIDIPGEHATHDVGTVQIAPGGILTGRVLLNDGVTAAANQPVQVRKESALLIDLFPNDRIFVNTRTNGDGTFTISLPEGTDYARIVLGNTDGTNCTNDCSRNVNNEVDIVAGEITDMGDVVLE